MVLNEKPTKNWKLRGLKLRGLGQNQISTPHFIYENDHRNKINIFGDFENETPTHMSATHAISKIEQKSQNRIPRELDQKFDIPRIVTIYWVSSTFFGNKKSVTEKSYGDFESRNSTYK